MPSPFISPSKALHTHIPQPPQRCAPRGASAPSPPAAAATCRRLSPEAPHHPSGRGLSRRALGAGGPSPQERRAPSPTRSPAPARSAPRNSRPPTSKGRAAHQSARPPAAPAPHSPEVPARAPPRDLASAPGRAPGPAPGSARSSPGPPRAGPGVGDHEESRGRGGGAGRQPGTRARSTGEGGEAADPSAPSTQKIRAGLRPRRGRPGPLRPPPGPAFNTGPVSSSHSAHQMSSGRFQQKLRRGFHRALQRREPAHGPARELRAAAPRAAPRAPATLPGAVRPHRPSRPGLRPAGPPPVPDAREEAGRDLAPRPGRAFFEAALRRPHPHPYLSQQGLGPGRRAPRTPGSRATHRCEGLFLFPRVQAATELPGPYQSAAGSSRLPRARLGEPVIPPRQSQPRSAGPRRPP